MKLALKLPLAFAIALVLLFGAGLFGISQLNNAVRTYEEDVLLRVSAHKKSAEISAHFAVAIQEWKNVLLRGKDAKELDKYWGSHGKEMAEVNRLLGELQGLVNDGEEKALVQKLTAEMGNAQEGYRKAFADFKAADFDHVAGDKAAKGKDREAAAQLVALREKLSKAEKDVSLEASASAQSATWTALVVMVLVTVAALVASVWMSQRIVSHLRRAVEVAERVAQGDLSNTIDFEGRDEIAALLHSLNLMQDHLTSLVTHVRQSADGVADASAEIAHGNHDLSIRTEQQATALQQTVSSMMELGSAVEHGADNARQASQLAMNASTVAARGGAVVEQVVQTMQGIDNSSHRIADIISVIDGIAFQTNILALNAAVEAARAGEQGRGFAVVASEVRLLAGRSATAAKEIKELITTSVERVEQGTTLVAQAGTTMQEVLDSIRKVNDIVSGISAANTDQNTQVAQVGQAVHRIDETTQQNAALVEEMAAAASSLKGQAQELVGAVSAFKLGANQHTRTPALAHT